jgi:uncharacterized membrane protein YgcG
MKVKATSDVKKSVAYLYRVMTKFK